jgi:quercetin dioxygenase-like cupin family protein
MPFIDTQTLPLQAPLPGWSGRFVTTERMTFAFYEVAAGAAIHEHHHPNEEVWQVLDGELAVTIDGRTEVARAGCVAVVPANTLHAVRALTAARAIVVDCPARPVIGAVTTI